MNALGEAKHADIAIAFGNKEGLIIKEGELVGKYKENEILEIFMQEVLNLAKQRAKQDS